MKRMHMHRTNRRHTVVCRLLLIVLLGLGVQVQAAELPARLDWSHRVELTTPVSGVIQEVRVVPGQQVLAGALLLLLDPRAYQAAVSGARARLHDLQEIRKEAQREWERSEELYERTVLSDHELQVKKNALTTATANVQSAQAALVQAELDLEYSRLRAPFDAFVIQRQAEVGQMVNSELRQDTLLILAASGKMLARTALPLEALEKLQPGQSLEVQVGGLRYPGKVLTLGYEPDTQNAQADRYPLIVEFSTGETVLRAGQAARVILP